MERHVITVTTIADGSGTGYSSRVARGVVHAIRYVKTDYANGVDFVVTGESSGIEILTATDANATATYEPRGATHSIAGAALLYAASGAAVSAPIPMAGERIKVVVAQGGDTKTGTFHVWVGP